MVKYPDQVGSLNPRRGSFMKMFHDNVRFLHVNCNTVNYFGEKCVLNYSSEQIMQFPKGNLVLFTTIPDTVIRSVMSSYLSSNKRVLRKHRKVTN